MCRYGNYGPYKNHYACFSCRKAFKRLQEYEWPDHLRPVEGEAVPAPCPECRQPMADMGLDFKPPKQRDVEHWAVVEFLFRKGITYNSCGCGGPGYRPSRWVDVPAFLNSHQCRPAGELLAATFAARRGLPSRRSRNFTR
ncbi:MAG: hypothetical protein ACOVT5_07230 [Armatimonadaceae bacterium]